MNTESKKTIIFGANDMGKRAFEYFTKDNPNAVYCFADLCNAGTMFCGIAVISFNELVRIHDDYQIAICVFDLFKLVQDLVKAEIYNIFIWDDDILISDDEKIEKSSSYNDYLRSLEQTTNSRKKILYGAGQYGERAYYYYGEELIFAFVDKKKCGTSFHGKTVLDPSELTHLHKDYDVVICVKQYDEIINYLSRIGVSDYYLFIGIGDVRADKPHFDSYLKDTIYDPMLIDEISKLDFIENPELLGEYYNIYTSDRRKNVQIRTKSNERLSEPRLIEENKKYGYFDSIRNYSQRDNYYYEAPAVCHGYWIKENPVLIQWNNLIEPGTMMRGSYHSASKDCLYFIVGPYFQYSDSFYEETELTKQKEILGKNLTVFPVHSIPSTAVDFDCKKFVKAVLEEAKDFDSLSVCMYHNDYYSETTKLFLANGAKIVTAGFISDPSFVKRLKSIMLMSDAVLTNGLGSHVNHALSVNKPVKLITQTIKAYSVFHDNDISAEIHGSPEFVLRRVLETDEYCVTKEQMDAYEPSTGFTKTKSKEEMGAIFDLSKRIIQNCDYKRSKYVDSIRQTYRDLQKAVTAEEKYMFQLMREALPEDYEDYLKKLGV